ncbi:MAG: DMT family transporter, partial [Clostridia bacterium]
MKQQGLAYASLTLAMVIVGSSVVAGKLLVETVPVFIASALRFGIASVLFLLIWWMTDREKPAFAKSELRLLLLMSFTGTFLFSTCMLFGLQYTGATEAGVMTSTTPVLTALLAALLLKERLAWPIVFGVLAAFIGVALIQTSQPPVGVAGGSTLWGSLLIFVAVVGEALFSVIGKGLTAKYRPFTISAMVSILGFLMFVPLAVLQMIQLDFTLDLLTLADWSYLVYYALVVTLLGYYFWYVGVKRVPGHVSGLFTAVLPVSAV